MSNVTNLFLELLDDAEAHNSDSKAVLFFRELLETTSIDVESKMSDVECDGSNTVFENHEHPEEIITAISALDNCNVSEAVDAGLSTNINLGYNVDSSLSITFSRSDHFNIQSDLEHSLHLRKANFIDFDDKFNEKNITEFINHIFSGKVLGNPLDNIDINIEETEEQDDDAIVIVTLEGMEFVIKDLIYQAVSHAYLELDSDQLP